MRKYTQNLFLCLFLICSTGHADAQPFPAHFSEKGTQFLSLGVGLFPTFFKDDGHVLVPPSSIAYEKRLTKILGLGASLGYSNTISKIEFGSNAEFKAYQNHFFYFNVRTGAHCLLYKKWNVYGGVSMGFYHIKVKAQNGSFGDFEYHRGIKEKSSALVWNAFVGFRYHCCGRLVFHCELSYGVSILNLGVGVKL